MDYTQVLALLKDASPFDLFRIKTAIQNEIESPEKIKMIRRCFAVGDQVSYFDNNTNSLRPALVLEKNIKKVLVQDLVDNKKWNMPYYMLNLTGKESDIHAPAQAKLTKNHLKVGELVGFMNEGKQIIGHINKLNHKTVSLITLENKSWYVYYGSLFKVLENGLETNSGRLLIEQNCEDYNKPA